MNTKERMKYETRWQQIIDARMSVERLVTQGKEVVYENMPEYFPPRFRAMVRRYYLNDGVMDDFFYYADEIEQYD